MTAVQGFATRGAIGRRLMVLAAMAALAGCQPAAVQAPPPPPVAVNGVGYLLFNAPIVPSSRDMFIANVDQLRRTGATEIDIGINSPGGDIDAAQGIVDYMARLHTQDGVSFKAYNVGLVASAATYVFLNAQGRYTAPRSAFLFHAAGATSQGPVNAQTLRDEADKLDAYERTVRATLKARTHLSDAEALTYVRRTVLLSADDARRDGIVDGIAAFTVPNGARSWVIANRPQPGRPVPRPVVTPPAPQG